MRVSASSFTGDPAWEDYSVCESNHSELVSHRTGGRPDKADLVYSYRSIAELAQTIKEFGHIDSTPRLGCSHNFRATCFISQNIGGDCQPEGLVHLFVDDVEAWYEQLQQSLPPAHAGLFELKGPPNENITDCDRQSPWLRMVTKFEFARGWSTRCDPAGRGSFHSCLY